MQHNKKHQTDISTFKYVSIFHINAGNCTIIISACLHTTACYLATCLCYYAYYAASLNKATTDIFVFNQTNSINPIDEYKQEVRNLFLGRAKGRFGIASAQHFDCITLFSITEKRRGKFRQKKLNS